MEPATTRTSASLPVPRYPELPRSKASSLHHQPIGYYNLQGRARPAIKFIPPSPSPIHPSPRPFLPHLFQSLVGCNTLKSQSHPQLRPTLARAPVAGFRSEGFAGRREEPKFGGSCHGSSGSDPLSGRCLPPRSRRSWCPSSCPPWPLAIPRGASNSRYMTIWFGTRNIPLRYTRKYAFSPSVTPWFLRYELLATSLNPSNGAEHGALVL